MAAPTETYIDPSIAGDSGAGTVGDPYGDIQHALDTVTRDSTNGDRFNVKAGTDEILAAALDFSTYGTPTAAAPWIMQGYTSAAADGGIGGVSGNGSYGMFASAALDYIGLIDMHLHNSGSATIVNLDNYIYMENCEVDNTTGGGIHADTAGFVIFCHVHNCGGTGIDTRGLVMYCTLENGTNDFSTAIVIGSGSHGVLFNVIDIDGSTDGISISTASESAAAFNSVYSSSGTGQGIIAGGTGATSGSVFNNIVEGFSGVGGIGYDINARLFVYGHNYAYNNTTNFDVAAGITAFVALGNNTALTASPFIDAANDDFRIKPLVQALGYPTGDWADLSVRSYLDIGALQAEAMIGPALRGRNTLLRR